MGVDDPARRELAERQARLVRALGGAAPPPEGFDADRLRVAGQALLRKRARTVAGVWPALRQAPGERFAAEFAEYAGAHPLPAAGAGRDAADFARHLARRGLLPWRLRWRLLLPEWLRWRRPGPGA